MAYGQQDAPQQMAYGQQDAPQQMAYGKQDAPQQMAYGQEQTPQQMAYGEPQAPQQQMAYGQQDAPPPYDSSMMRQGQGVVLGATLIDRIYMESLSGILKIAEIFVSISIFLVGVN